MMQDASLMHAILTNLSKLPPLEMIKNSQPELDHLKQYHMLFGNQQAISQARSCMLGSRQHGAPPQEPELVTMSYKLLKTLCADRASLRLSCMHSHDACLHCKLDMVTNNACSLTTTLQDRDAPN